MALPKTLVYILCFTLIKVATSAPTEEFLEPWTENTMTETTTESSTSISNETMTDFVNSTMSASTEIISTTFEISNSTDETFEAGGDIIDETIPWEYEQETTAAPTLAPPPPKPSSASSAYLQCLALVFACSVLSTEKLLLRL